MRKAKCNTLLFQFLPFVDNKTEARKRICESIAQFHSLGLFCREIRLIYEKILEYLI